MNNKDNIFIIQPFGKQGSIDYLIIIEGFLILIEVKTSKKCSIVLNNHIPNINVLYLISFKNESFLDLKNIYLINGYVLLNNKEYDYLNFIFKKEDNIEKLKNKTKEELLFLKNEIENEMKNISNKYIKDILLSELNHIEGILILQDNKYNLKPYNRKNFQINSSNIIKFNESIFDIINKI